MNSKDNLGYGVRPCLDILCFISFGVYIEDLFIYSNCFTFVCSVCVFVCRGVRVEVRGKLNRTQFSPSTFISVLKTQHRLPGLEARALTCWAILPAPYLFVTYPRLVLNLCSSYSGIPSAMVTSVLRHSQFS